MDCLIWIHPPFFSFLELKARTQKKGLPNIRQSFAMQSDPGNMIMFMFLSSVLLGSFVTGMTPLISDVRHYTVSWTRVVSAWYMASWMGIVELVMHSRMTSVWNSTYSWWTIVMLFSAVLALVMLQSQVFVDEPAWAARMVEHHSTAITTSENICAKCDLSTLLCQLACTIADVQKEEINVLLSNSDVVMTSLFSSVFVSLVTFPALFVLYKRL